MASYSLLIGFETNRRHWHEMEEIRLRISFMWGKQGDENGDQRGEGARGRVDSE